jgi:hypothetical protein
LGAYQAAARAGKRVATLSSNEVALSLGEEREQFSEELRNVLGLLKCGADLNDKSYAAEGDPFALFWVIGTGRDGYRSRRKTLSFYEMGVGTALRDSAELGISSAT